MRQRKVVRKNVLSQKRCEALLVSHPTTRSQRQRPKPDRPTQPTIRLWFRLGRPVSRLHPDKGMHLLVTAVQAHADYPGSGMGLEGLGADGWRHSPKNRGHPQRHAPDDQKAKIFATLASIPPPFSYDAREEGAASRWTSNTNKPCPLEAYQQASCRHRISLLPPRRVGTLRRSNSRDIA